MAKSAHKWQQYQTLMNNVHDGILVMDIQGNILEVNPSFSQMLGYTQDELQQLNISDLNAQWSKQELLKILNQLVGQSARFDTIHKRKDGTLINVEIHSTGAVIDGEVFFFASSRDITRRKQEQDALELMKYSIDHLVDAVHWVDKDARIVYANEAMCRKLGYSMEELLSMKIHDIDPDFSAEDWPESWEEFKRRGSMTFETRHRCKNGYTFPVEIKLNNLYFQGKELNCVYAQDITERKKTEELIWRHANFDSLTSLPNRRMFHDRLEQEILKSQRSSLPLAVLLIDLDDFKEVNDALGHDQGDILLKEAASRIANCVRETDTVARLGGDEFTVLLPQLTETNHADNIAQKIISRLTEPFTLSDNMTYISASIGITLYPVDASDVDTVLKNADQAMYLSKQLGRNRFSYFTQHLQEEARNRFKLTNELREALATNKQFEVFYQPIVELATGSINKAEALIRWHHPERGLVNPAEFIPLAEDTGLVIDIGYFVFQQAVQQARLWQRLFNQDFQISVNRSPIEFQDYYKRNHLRHLNYMRDMEQAGKSIVFEITENMLLKAENTGVSELLLEFRDSGIQVALDDFGTGYSSLSYLKKFDIDYLKIDQSFIKNLSIDNNDVVLCEAIIVMAHKLGLRVIAEGIETEAQRKILTDAGCDYAQGYLFSRPVSATDFEKLLAN
ncbi:MAG: EAL domain-containing protein [Gammaproteobacteria bacterium]|jgi:diguanylate cyclase (GGDEF)-like protein/PAS domain S-box-containing protein